MFANLCHASLYTQIHTKSRQKEKATETSSEIGIKNSMLIQGWIRPIPSNQSISMSHLDPVLVWTHAAPSDANLGEAYLKMVQ